MNMKALGVIPARLGSSRFPGKPLAEFFGKTMVEHTYEAANASKKLNKVIVASDSEKILRVIDQLGGETKLTGECDTGTDRVVQVLHSMDRKEFDEYDVVVNIQGDEPGVNPRHIDACVVALREDQNCVMSTLATPITNEKEARSNDVVKCVVDANSNALYFSRAMIPHAKDGAYRPDSASYLKHVGLYAFQKNFLMQFPSLPRTELELTEDLEQLRILSAGYKIKIVKVDSTLPGVDTKHDLKYLTSVWPHKCSS